MTTATATRPVTRPSPLRHALRVQLRLVAPLTLWFWAIAVVGAVVATVVLAAVRDDVVTTVVGLARQGGIWVLFAQSIVLVAVYLRVHVAAGMTRRVFVRSSAVTAVGVGVLYGVVLTVLVLLEGVVHDALGWDTTVTDALLPGPHDSAAALLAEYVPMHVVASVTGLLVGSAYQRLGGWWGTLALPLTFLPLAALLSLSAGQVGPVTLAEPLGAGAATAVHVLGALVLTAVATAAHAAVTRSLPLRTTG
ncbi:hypothetical protein AB6N23_05045 [Cellulomonas sp. 179-A 9B4 NHS]|uniref:hypothetical protein n=1 Tax=Cellulomonas sp. 179-A 9B4 NHS TaxID=3142379 RepID=UPI0039A00570